MFATIRAVAVCFPIVVTVLSNGPVQAQTTNEQLQEWCDGRGNVSEDVQISSCTAIINSGQYDRWDLHVAYYHRGYSYAQIGRYDLCVADLTQSIRLEPKDADAYWLRHLCKKDLGDLAGAEADKKAAKRIDPTIEQQWED